jgi:hypothetical protein
MRLRVARIRSGAHVVARRRVLASLASLAGFVLVSACGTYNSGSVQEGEGYSFPKLREGHDQSSDR